MPESNSLPPSIAGRTGRVMAFRVNRRPLGEGTLIQEEQPSSAFDHFARMLAPGFEVHTHGHGSDRSWKVGAIEIDTENGFVTGKLGWHAQNPEVVPSWSDELMDWATTETDPAETLLPFAFDREKRLLGVVHDKKSAANTLAQVFEMILNRNELQLLNPTTAWSVEPVLNAEEFVDWLHSLDVVQSVGFKARLPNPEPRAAFEDLTDRMQDAHGTEYTARMKSSKDEGLQNIENDPEFRQAIAMGEEGFAQLEGQGRRAGRKSTYRQSEKVASERVPKLPEDMPSMRTMLKQMVRERLRRFMLEDDEAA